MRTIKIIKNYIPNITKCLMTVTVLSLSSANAKIRDFETTRLKSTAGAGAGSILLDESTVLNPAPLAFFDTSAIYFQKMGADTTTSADSMNPIIQPESNTVAVIASDAGGGLSGSLSYHKQTQGIESRKSIGVSVSGRVGTKSSFGTTYKFSTDNEDINNSGEVVEKKYKQATFGISHAINENVSLGLIAVDPFQVKPEETKAIVGMQYVYQNFFALMLDTGANYNDDLSKTLLYKAALQLTIFSDFFLRVGTFNDKGNRERGNGAGISWIQPKLSFDFAFKNTTISEYQERFEPGQEIKETSFSVSYRF